MLKQIAGEKFKSKTEIVYNFLKTNILKGELKTGEKIVVKKISKILKISDIPIREAIKKLEAEGFVTITPHVGACVIEIAKSDLEEIHAIRTELEGFATRLAVPFLNDKDFNKLEKIIKESEEAIEAGRFKRNSELNIEFHLTIYHRAPNKRLIKMLTELWNQSLLISSSLIMSDERVKQSIEEHKQILEALRIGDGDLASHIIKKQKKKAWVTISKFLDENK